MPAQSRLRRYLPMALFLLALAALVISLAGARSPSHACLLVSATVMLALDISGSIEQRDISPSRLGAAKQAALGFIERQKNTNQIGIVAFAGIAQLTSPRAPILRR